MKEPKSTLNIFGAIVTGLVVGALARLFYPGAIEMGWIATVLLGVCGSLLAGLVFHRGRGEFHRGGCLSSILGAMALILIAQLLDFQGLENLGIEGLDF